MTRSKARGRGRARKSVTTIEPQDRVFRDVTSIPDGSPNQKNRETQQEPREPPHAMRLRPRPRPPLASLGGPGSRPSPSSSSAPLDFFAIQKAERRKKKLERRAEKKAATAQKLQSESYLQANPEEALDDFTALNTVIKSMHRKQKSEQRVQHFKDRRLAQRKAEQEIRAARAAVEEKSREDSLAAARMVDHITDQMRTLTAKPAQDESHILGALESEPKEQEEKPYSPPDRLPYSPKLSDDFIM